MWEFGLNNLWEFGKLTKCSRFLAGTPIPPIATNCRTGTDQFRAVLLPGEGFAEFYQWQAYFRLRDHFPYGYDVQPDDHT